MSPFCFHIHTYTQRFYVSVCIYYILYAFPSCALSIYLPLSPRRSPFTPSARICFSLYAPPTPPPPPPPVMRLPSATSPAQLIADRCPRGWSETGRIRRGACCNRRRRRRRHGQFTRSIFATREARSCRDTTTLFVIPIDLFFFFAPRTLRKSITGRTPGAPTNRRKRDQPRI